jgi:hypothetical protein
MVFENHIQRRQWIKRSKPVHQRWDMPLADENDEAVTFVF